ncbi:Imm63 family immunity protein [Lysobacter sp. F60174L2]|uniref:Imm63 family immunity protein n=1 Tax=Lysobacter sp. F60174L2 TaxID=3459295 RepID=UPI00403D89F0
MSQDFLHLQERYAHLCELLAPYEPKNPRRNWIQTQRSDDGSPHVEFVNGKYNYVVTERGFEFERRIAQSEDELLYWFIGGVTANIASQFELENRIPGEDSRRQLFAKNLALLARLDPQWANRKQSEYEHVLSEHPFRDEA